MVVYGNWRTTTNCPHTMGIPLWLKKMALCVRVYSRDQLAVRAKILATCSHIYGTYVLGYLV